MPPATYNVWSFDIVHRRMVPGALAPPVRRHRPRIAGRRLAPGIT
ncbi:MAG TPA: hypothetical protein VMU33_05085 [Burkholderiaceae bacterium]|nr:hypothetical protein [Burkholderiaceae bacterium]